MTTAIAMRNATNVYLKNVTIRGFNKGIEARNSHLLLDGINVQRCGIGLDLIGSKAILYRSQLFDNAVDIVVNKSTAYIIDSVVYSILRILPKDDYRIDPYRIGRIAFWIVNTADAHEKRRRLKQLLSLLKYTPLAWTVYQILKEALRFAR